ncbi:MAG TPA: RNA polymerase sigma factor [Acidimicrobiales bacterium]|nr:RNA polymerase sigma factor [Acidimicrobiales bacterium]
MTVREAAEPGPDGDALLARAANGDTTAFGELYRLQSTKVAAFFYRRTFCPDTTAELTAETVARAIGAVHRFDARKGTAAGWLFGIANKVLLEWIRKGHAAKKASNRLGLQIVPFLPEELERVEELADADRFRVALAAALAQLSPGQRDAVILRIADDLPYEEVARRLGCSEGAARVRVTRALAQLSISVLPS